MAESDGQDEDGTKREADESAGIKAQTPGQGKEAAHGVTRSNDYVTRHAAQGTDTDFKPVDQNDVLAGDDSVPEDFYSLATDLPASKVEQFAKKVKQQLMIQDWDALSGELSYPVTVDGVIYDTPEEFLAADFGADLNPYFFRGVGGRNLQQDVLQLERHHAWKNRPGMGGGGLERRFIIPGT